MKRHPQKHYDGLPGSGGRVRVLKTRGRHKSNSPPHLTPQRAGLVRALAEGKTLKEAAGERGLTYGSAKEYLGIARKSLGIRTTNHLVALYVQGRVPVL